MCVDAVSAVAVEGRGRSRTVALFNMRCDGQQLPESADGQKVRLYRARGVFAGKAAPWNEGSPGLPSAASAEGRTALGVGGGRVFGILTPDLVADPAIWFTLPLRALRVVESGQQGLLKKRPVSIMLGCEDWQVRLSDVNIIIPASGGRQQAGQEATLVKELRG
jgi:hypothetical protein